HKSFGLTVLALAVLRFILRLKLGAPPLPESIPAHERALAHMSHWLFYVFMIGIPLSGYVMTASFGTPLKWFGLPVPHLIGIDRDRGHLFADIHAYAAYTLIGLITIHVLAVVLHYVKHRTNLLKRMI